MTDLQIGIRGGAIGVLLFLLLIPDFLFPCTVGVVSGRSTPDGRPLLWKNRDTSDPDNKLVYIRASGHAFIAVVNASDNQARSIWQGLNERGFAIINSLSRDLAPGPRDYFGNGLFMRLALETCADVKEFEALLKKTNGSRKVAANYGVIDAHGRACFYETGADGYARFDADDPRVAPQGYIIRTNYAFTAPPETQGGGYIRFERASHLFQRAASEQNLDLRFILRRAARDLANEKLHSDPMSQSPGGDPGRPLYVRTNDTINRASTMSVSVIHGAPGPDRPDLATMWTLLGQPVCGVALPLWVASGSVPDALTGSDTAPLCDLARELADWLYPDQRANMRQYLNLTRLLGFEGEGIPARLFSIEDRIMQETGEALSRWTQSAPDAGEIADFQNRTSRNAYSALRETFSSILRR